MISIITPVYNAASYIESCMKSVADQYFEGLEHVIVDAASTDGTLDKIKDFAEGKPYIRWISEKDKGQSDAMNKGISLATNPVISFLNADDRYEPGALNIALQFFQNAKPNSFLVGDCRVLKENGEPYMINKPHPFDPVSFMLDFNFPYNPSAYFYHKSIHDRVGLYDLEDHFTMDIDFIFRMMPVGNVTYVDRILGNYIMVTNSKTMTEIASGRNKENLNTIFERYYPKMTLRKRLKLKLLQSLGTNRGWILFYWNSPIEIWKQVWKKVS